MLTIFVCGKPRIRKNKKEGTERGGVPGSAREDWGVTDAGEGGGALHVGPDSNLPNLGASGAQKIFFGLWDGDADLAPQFPPKCCKW